MNGKIKIFIINFYNCLQECGVRFDAPYGIIPTQDDRKNSEGILTKLARLRAKLIPTQDDRKNPERILAKLARLRAKLMI